MIPRRIIRCVPADVPERYDEFWRGWQVKYPGWDFVTLQDPIDPRAWPMLGHLHQYATSGAQLAGMVRVEAVWFFGGFYVDMDCEPARRSLEELRPHPLVIGTEDGVHLTDAMFGAEAGHLGLADTITHVRRIYDGWLGRQVDELPAPGAQTTGPLATTHCLSQRADVTVLSSRAFYPYTYHGPERAWGDRQPAGVFDESYAVHRWAHTWAGT